MKKAVAYLIPFIEAEKKPGDVEEKKGTIVMATVKGDVHDIGKNIVGVVLQCNNYEVIDLGVMVPAQKIIDTAREVDADLIGLSGLITPSLDEMVTFATEMQRQGFDIPLLVGGATTSRAHTAVKVDPKYDGPVVWVKDASRSVPVASSLLSAERRGKLIDDVNADYDSIRERHAAKHNDRVMLPLADARANATPVEWEGYAPPQPRMTDAGPRPHRLPARRAARLHRLAAVLQRLGDEGPLPRHPQQPLGRRGRPQAVRRRPGDARPGGRGGLAARQRGGRAVPGQRRRRRHRGLHRRVRAPRCCTRLSHLRQQGQHRDGVPNRSLADYVAPKETGLPDHVGAFAVTAGLGSQDRVAAFKAEHDDYSAILLESLADRLAEAFAERLHELVRTDLWGYAARRAARRRGPAQGAVRRHPARPGLPGLPRAHREGARSGSCSTSRRPPASSSPRAWRCGPAPR